MTLIDWAVAYLLWWVVKNAALDIIHALKGTENPRWAVKKAKAKAAGQATPAQPRYGVKDWWADFRSDALVAQTEWRREQDEKKKRAKAEPIDDMLDVVRTRREPPASDPWDHSEPLRQGVDETRTTRQPLDVVDDTTAPQQPEQQTPEAGATGSADPDKTQPIPTPEEPADDRPNAPVIPLFREPKGILPMPFQTTEITGLDPAIAYASDLAASAGDHGQAGNEGYIAALQNAKVTGAGIATALEMQEAFALAAAAAEKHKAELEKQKGVQEAYDQVPDAGDKAFMQNGR